MEGAMTILGLILLAFGIYLIDQFIFWISQHLVAAAGVVVCSFVIFIACLGREEIARWYYFTFYPHPAEPAVRSALAQGRLLDGNRLAAVLGEVPPENRILREVRIAQGERLVAEMRQASDATIRESLKAARSHQERAAYLGIQEAIGLAAAALERAKAAHAASKSA